MKRIVFNLMLLLISMGMAQWKSTGDVFFVS